MKPESARSKLQLDPEALRQLGYRMVDMIVDHQQALPNLPTSQLIDWRDTETARVAPFPEDGISPEAALEHLEREVFAKMMRPDHPRFFSFIPSPGNAVSALSEALAAAFNPFAGAWLEASGPAVVELATINWLREVCGMPETAGGLFLSGGSAANLTALAVARRVRLNDDIGGAVVYYSDQTHSSVERALRALGFSLSQIRKLPSDETFRVSMGALREQVAADRRSGQKPFCVIANAGTTNTGSVDPLSELVRFCRAEGLWLHADGAYGAAAMLCERGRRELQGIEDVDSLSIDPHKWLFQPFEIGCVLLREVQHLPDTFRIFPEYLQDIHEQEGVNFCDYGLQLTRSFRALKLWLSLQVFGVAAFREAMEYGFELSQATEQRLRSSDKWEILSPSTLAIVCFRYAPPETRESDLDALNSRLSHTLFHDGFAAIVTTRLNGHTALRMCTINPRTTVADIEATIAKMEALGRQLV